MRAVFLYLGLRAFFISSAVSSLKGDFFRVEHIFTITSLPLFGERFFFVLFKSKRIFNNFRRLPLWG